MDIVTLASQSVVGKRILLRADLNVPLAEGRISSDARLLAVLPTVTLLLSAGASRIMLLSHLGRPNQRDLAFSLAPVADWFSAKLKRPVPLIENYLEGIPTNTPELVVLENVRFNEGEEENSQGLGKQYGALCDLLVVEAFATAHRAQASCVAVCDEVPVACAGPLFLSEMEALESAVKNPTRPLVAIIGGAKISTKLPLLHHLNRLADHLVIGGGIATTLLAAQGQPVGDSLYEPALLTEAKRLLETLRWSPPIDLIVSTGTEVSVRNCDQIAPQDRVMDLGPRTLEAIEAVIAGAKTVLWNGPLGCFEQPAFSLGTKRLANAIAGSKAFSVAGGGDTVAALDLFGVRNQISYVSTAGGAFLEFIEGKSLPVIEALKRHAAKGHGYGKQV